MTTSRDYSVNLSVQQVLSLWVQGSTLQHFTGTRGCVRPAAPPSASIFKAPSGIQPQSNQITSGRKLTLSLEFDHVISCSTVLRKF